MKRREKTWSYYKGWINLDINFMTGFNGNDLSLSFNPHLRWGDGVWFMGDISIFGIFLGLWIDIGPRVNEIKGRT